MTQNQMILLAIIVGVLLLNIGIGVVAATITKRRQNTTKEKSFFIAGRGLGALVLAMTTMATYTSVSSFVSGPGAAGMTYGYAQVWVAAVQVPVTFLVLGVLGNKLAIISRRTGAVTIAGYLKARYQSNVLVAVTSLLMVAFFIAMMISQFIGGATLIQSVTGVDYKIALIIFAATVVLYTSVGGFTSVAITDTIQGLIMCVGTFLLIFFVLQAGGGLEGIDAGLKQNLPTYDDLTAVYTPGALISYWVLVGFGTLGLPQTAVRGMAFKDTKSLRRAMIIGTVTCAIVMVGMHLAGAWAGALVDANNLPTSDYFIPYIVQQVMPVGLAGLFLAAPMAAIMSTTDSLLLLASASILKDLYQNFFVKDDAKKQAAYTKNMGKMTFGITFVLGAIVVILAVTPPDIIFFLNMFAFGGLECTFLWPLVGGLFWKRGTKQAALASSIGAAAVYVFCHYNVHVLGLSAVWWGLLAGGILYFAVGMATSKNGPDPKMLEQCF